MFKKINIFILCVLLILNFKVSAMGVNNMTLDEKLGQMVCLSFKNWIQSEDIINETRSVSNVAPVTEINDDIRNIISRYHIGSVILFGENLSSKEQSKTLISDLQSATLKSGNPPLIIAVDQEGGRVERFSFGRDRLKNNGEIKTSKEAFEKGRLIAKELKELGINCDLAPVVDVNSNPDNPVINVRAFGDKADIVSEFGKSFLEGLHSENIIATAKHFPGHGDTSVDSHVCLPVVNKNLDKLNELELKPFKALSDAGVDMMMVAHISLPKIEDRTVVSRKSGKEIYLPATLSNTIIDGLLRRKIGFNGIIITDAMDMEAISGNFGENESSKMAIIAGADIICMPVCIESKMDIIRLDRLFEYLKEAVANGKISEKQIDASVERILKLKEKL